MDEAEELFEQWDHPLVSQKCDLPFRPGWGVSVPVDDALDPANPLSVDTVHLEAEEL